MLRFCDTNKELVEAVDALFKKYNYESKFFGKLKAIHGDIFKEQNKNGGTICTASNPSFTMGAGLDFEISKRYKIENPSEFKKDGVLFYLVTVDNQLKSDERIIMRALCGVLGFREYDLILTGIGTGIGGLSIKEFLKLLERALVGNMYGVDMSGANMRSSNMSGADMSYSDMRSSNMSYSDMRSSDMSGANMRGADMRSSNMSGANMSYSDMRYSNMRGANMSGADMHSSNMSYSDMHSSNMSGADMSYSDMRSSNMSGADMSGADISEANISANISGVKGIRDMSDWFDENFEKGKDGYIVYKAIGKTNYDIKKEWKIKKGEYLTENVNMNPTYECGCGVNFGTLEYIKNKHSTAEQFWECLIEWKDLVSTVVPYNTDGKARCARLKLVKKIAL